MFDFVNPLRATDSKSTRTLVPALGHLVGPHAHTRFPVVSESGAALVAGSLAIPAVPEHVAFLLVREDTVQP